MKSRVTLNGAIPPPKFRLPDIIEVMRDARWLGRYFAGDSWLTWQAVLKAAFALPMTVDDISRFKAVAGNRQPPTQPVKELWCICGRRAGKDSIASLLVAYTSVFNAYANRLRPGERATVVCL